MLYELHSHLYGCLTAEDLEFLAARKPPRWKIFLDSYQKTYGRRPDIERLFQQTAESKQLLEEYYYYMEAGNFARFQTGFDLIITVAHTDAEELELVTRRVLNHDDADYAEYRMIFPVRDSVDTFAEKVHACCEGLQAAGRESAKIGRLAVSLWRDETIGRPFYDKLRELMNAQSLVREVVTAVDFCHVEEGHPPKHKRAFFEEVLRENRERPEQALAILYHVGESFTDKSVESAARWVVEAAEAGAHRLGHCIALGIDPEYYSAKPRRTELVSERLDQITFELRHRDDLIAAGYDVDADALSYEARKLNNLTQDDAIPVDYGTPARREQLRRFQDYCMSRVRATGAIIESCPTSNLRIAALGDPRFHPLARFLKNGLPVVIGADDPGILRTSLRRELALVRDWPGVSEDDVSAMIERAAGATSEILSGRAAPA